MKKTELEILKCTDIEDKTLSYLTMSNHQTPVLNARIY